MLGSQAYLIMQNIFEALFWFLLPISMVICNDIFAYLFGNTRTHTLCYFTPTISVFMNIHNIGFFFGRTRLIKLSPKKTWEGFLGAFVSTVVYGFIVSHMHSAFSVPGVRLIPLDFSPLQFSYVLAKYDFFVCVS